MCLHFYLTRAAASVLFSFHPFVYIGRAVLDIHFFRLVLVQILDFKQFQAKVFVL
jgi:hypothetical protein